MSQVDDALRKLDSSGQVTTNAVNALLSTLIKQHSDGQIDMPTLLVSSFRPFFLLNRFLNKSFC